jgi:voltage-gated potassium channel
MNLRFVRLLQSVISVGVVILIGGFSLFWLGKGRWSLGESLSMAVISVSTVGFGELPELSQVRFARGITVMTILAGLGSVAFFQSAMTALLINGVIGQTWRKTIMRKAIAQLNGHIIVAGVGSTGKHVVEEMIATNAPFVVIDRDGEVLHRLSQELTGGKMLYVQGDATHDHTLIYAGIERSSGLIAALTHDRDNLFVTLSARALNARARIITKVVENEAIAKMMRAGANATVSPNIIGGRRLASEMLRPSVVEFLDQMMRDRDKNLRFEEIGIPHDSPFVGKVLRDVPLRKEAQALVVAVRDQNRKFRYNPGPDFLIEAGTVLILIGEAHRMPALRAMIEGRTAS